METAAGTVAGWLCALLGVASLRLAWRRRPTPSLWLLAGWGLLALGLFAWATTTGADVAVALGLLIPSLAAYAILAARLDIRPVRSARPPRGEVELEAAPTSPWRALLRALYVGPLAALAAFACGAAVALKAPWAQADRLVFGGLLVPVLWAAGMIWATTDNRLARIGLGLAAGSLASLAVAVV